MNPTFSDMIEDIEKLVGEELEGIKPNTKLRILSVDHAKEHIVVQSCSDLRTIKRSFSELNTLWAELTSKAFTDKPWVHVDSVLKGSGSRRNQPETLLANLPYIVYSRHENRKCIVYIGKEAHKAGEIFEMSESEIKAALRELYIVEGRAKLLGKARNRIIAGAPGTGKSFQLKKLAKDSFPSKNVRCITFYPDYTYSQFVGGYRPFPLLDEKDKPTGAITYEFVPGPFLRTYVQAVQNPDEPYLLIIEEINRANSAAVFGDLFQLLDRDKDGRSVYELDVPKEMQLYLKVRLPEYHTNNNIGTTPEEHQAFCYEEVRLFDETMRLSIPPNMYIWATMNSADQGVFPIDTAFRRRWDFEHMDIDKGEDEIKDKVVTVANRKIYWNKLRRGINDLMKKANINEDKLLGPFFISPDDINDDRFNDVFKDKVLLYLYEDAGKMKRPQLFGENGATYSDICRQFNEKGLSVFCGNVFCDVYADEEAEQAEPLEVADDILSIASEEEPPEEPEE